MTQHYQHCLQALYPDRQVFDGGAGGQTSMQIAARQVADSAHKTWISIFWYGNNNWTKEEVKADIAASIASLAPGNRAFIVVSIINWANHAERGTAFYNDVVRVNGELAARYPDNYLDMRQHLVSLYNPNSPQDVLDKQNDLPPSSLRYDDIHFNPAGCAVVAAKFREFITAKGW